MSDTTLSLIEGHRSGKVLFAKVDTLTGTMVTDLDDARDVLARLQAAGVDYDDFTAVLGDEGVQKFTDSLKTLFDNVGGQTRRLGRRPMTTFIGTGS